MAFGNSNFTCPRCGSTTLVQRTQKSTTVIRRVRVCKGKERHAFETAEAIPHEERLVRKSNQTFVRFDVKGRLERSIALASAGTLKPEQISAVAERVMLRITTPDNDPIPTLAIGDAVLDELTIDHVPSALRYATVFLTSREQIDTPLDLLSRIYQRIPTIQGARGVPPEGHVSPVAEKLASPTPVTSAPPQRPTRVVKRGRAGRPVRWEEDFYIHKLWSGVERATRHLERTVKSDLGQQWGADPSLTAAVVAFVLRELGGQRTVTSAQFSASVMSVLRSVCPLGYLRFAVVAKGYTLVGQFLDELEDLVAHPSPGRDLGPLACEATQIESQVKALVARTRESAH